MGVFIPFSRRSKLTCKTLNRKTHHKCCHTQKGLVYLKPNKDRSFQKQAREAVWSKIRLALPVLRRKMTRMAMAENFIMLYIPTKTRNSKSSPRSIFKTKPQYCLKIAPSSSPPIFSSYLFLTLLTKSIRNTQAFPTGSECFLLKKKTARGIGGFYTYLLLSR